MFRRFDEILMLKKKRNFETVNVGKLENLGKAELNQAKLYASKLSKRPICNILETGKCIDLKLSGRILLLLLLLQLQIQLG